MKRREVAILGIRLSSAYMLYQGIMVSDLVAAGFWNLFQDYGENRTVTQRWAVLAASFLPFFLYIVAGCVMWFKARILAGWMLQGIDEPQSHGPVGSLDSTGAPAHPAPTPGLQTPAPLGSKDPGNDKAFSVGVHTVEQAGCTLFGVYALIHSLPPAINDAYMMYLLQGMPQAPALITVQVKSRFVANIVSVILALILITAGRKVLRLIGHLRHTVNRV